MIRHATNLFRCVFVMSLLSGSARSSMAADAVIVRPSAWAPAVQAWKAHRASQGIDVAELDSGMGRDAIRSTIAELANSSNGRLRFVLLAGDVGGPQAAEFNVPTFHHTSSAMVQFGGEPVIASDNAYADLDGDESPELAIGRIPADTAEQLSKTLNRIVLHEKNSDYSNWRRQVHVVAGVGGFGPVADSVIDMTTRRFLSDRIPGWSDVSMTQASLQSYYCPDPLRFSDTCIARMNQGGMFWVYIGHGYVNTLDYLQSGDALLPIMTNNNVPSVNTGARAPIAVFLACYTGAFDAREDSLAEQLVLSETGPIAAIAASRVSGPYGLAMLADGLLDSCFDKQTATLGEVILNAKRGLLDDTKYESQGENLDQIGMINAIADAMSPVDYDLRAERLEHVWQMNLIGDPMLRLSHPTRLEITAPSVAEPGETISVRGSATIAGKFTLELARCRGQIQTQTKDSRVGTETAAERERYQQRYIEANASLIVSQKAESEPGAFALQIQIPADLPRGKYCLRLFAEGQTGWQVGYHELRVKPPRR
jgi:hypothetical protein